MKFQFLAIFSVALLGCCVDEVLAQGAEVDYEQPMTSIHNGAITGD
jgi:hypothetical protein